MERELVMGFFILVLLVGSAVYLGHVVKSMTTCRQCGRNSGITIREAPRCQACGKRR